MEPWGRVGGWSLIWDGVMGCGGWVESHMRWSDEVGGWSHIWDGVKWVKSHMVWSDVVGWVESHIGWSHGVGWVGGVTYGVE